MQNKSKGPTTNHFLPGKRGDIGRSLRGPGPKNVRPYFALLFLVAAFACSRELCSILLASPADDYARVFSEGNQLFQQGKYEPAIASYDSLIRSGVRQPAVFYNLGNAHFKLGHWGLAIACYENAYRLDPTDPDNKENLLLARARRIDKIEEPETPFWLEMLSRLHHWLPFGKQQRCLLLLWTAANGLFLLYLWKKEESWRGPLTWGIIATLLLAGFMGVSLFVKLQQAEKKEAVILAEKSDLFSGPAENNSVLATIHEGLKVEVRQETGEWIQVVLPNGWNGWIRRNQLQILL